MRDVVVMWSVWSVLMVVDLLVVVHFVRTVLWSRNRDPHR